MIEQEKHIARIKGDFEKMSSKYDLLNLLNYVKPLIYKSKSFPFELKQLTFYYNIKPEDSSNVKSVVIDLNEILGNIKITKKEAETSDDKKYIKFLEEAMRTPNHRYTTYKISKKSGDTRTIHAPKNGLKSIQRCLNFILTIVYADYQHSAATGFISGKSIVDNAKIHSNSRYVYNIDLKNFFFSIDQARVWKCLQLAPFNLINNKVKIANIIASLCCTKIEVERKTESGEWEKVMRNVLPQGAPTSPLISNIVCHRLDFLLTGVAKRFGLKYSRYADDITFSSMHNVYQPDSEFLKELHRIILNQNFHIKERKTRLQKDGYRKEVTGLLVNESVNVQQRYIKQLRMWLYYWERYGYEKASKFFLQQYIADKGHIKNGKPDMKNVISGKLDYLKMVKGTDNKLYQKLKSRFESLLNSYDKSKINESREDYLNEILSVFISGGINVAMSKFYKN